MKNKNLIILFNTFFKIGLFTFGGGYSMIPFIEKEITQKHKFITSDELLDIFSISECTPCPISINCATFIGYKVCGFLGSLISTLGIVLPSFIIILILSLFFNSLKEFSIIVKFLQGIKVGVVILLISSIIKINSKSQKSKSYYVIIFSVLLLCLLTNISTITILFSSILLYSLIFTIKQKRR